jgi:hypothetical protein
VSQGEYSDRRFFCIFFFSDINFWVCFLCFVEEFFDAIIGECVPMLAQIILDGFESPTSFAALDVLYILSDNG